MAIKKLTAIQENQAKSWIHDTLILSGIKDKASSQRQGWNKLSMAERPVTTNMAKLIWEEVMYRKLDNINTAFDTLASYHFNSSLDDINSRYISVPAERLAVYVAWFCSINSIYWDNSVLTKYEMDEFTSTYLGQALKLYDCFTVSLAPVGKSASNNGHHANLTGVAPSGNVGELSASAVYTGPLSPYVRDLLSTAGSKEHLSGLVFRIEGKNANAAKVTPTAFIRPLTTSGRSGSTNQVFVGSANGRTECTVYFDDLVAANDFLTKCNAAGKIPATITTVHAAKKTADSNGYYKVNTEFGPVFISARKLKEALTEEAEAPIAEDTKDKEFDSFAFTDNLMKEI